MNENYALDPDAPADSRELKLLLDKFGLQTGRFLARYPEDWSEMLLKRLERASQMEQARALELLVRRRGLLVPSTAPYIPSTRWANNAAVASERHGAFAKVIGQDKNGFGWPSAQQVLYDDECELSEGRGAHVPMQAARYVECVRPLFLASAEIFVVDRFFTLRTEFGKPDRRRWPVLLAFLRLAESARNCEVVRLILERGRVEKTESSHDVLEHDIEVALEESGTKRISVEYEIRESVGHGRYVFSLHGGLQFDQGFEESRAASNHIHWLSKPELDPLLDRFGRSTLVAADRPRIR